MPHYQVPPFQNFSPKLNTSFTIQLSLPPTDHNQDHPSSGPPQGPPDLPNDQVSQSILPDLTTLPFSHAAATSILQPSRLDPKYNPNPNP